MDSLQFKDELKHLAIELGFDDFGVASLEDFTEPHVSVFKKWIAAGMNDKMGYLARNIEKRLSPKTFFPEANSAIVLSAGFFKKRENKKIALYAQTEDYHIVMKDALRPIVERLESLGGKQKVSVDTSPVLEKALALRAGIGWLGKNSLIITEKNGPWHFLAVIFTSIVFPADNSISNKCGSCSKCVESCPNSCIQNNNTIDTRRCISNLTIERKSLDDEEKKLLHGHIFGCDICLQACPWGDKAQTPKIEAFKKLIPFSEERKKRF